jgi:uncharacterized protein YceH (UPF0502 family)
VTVVDDPGPEDDGRLRLPAEQVRVLGALVEKQLTTPQQYPLTLNALTLACNQTSNRQPVVAYDEATTELAVRTLKQRGLTRFVHPTHGRSVLRYEHLLGDVLGLDRRQLAILAVLLLRGPQTVGELRSRTERMVEFEDLGSIDHELELLAAQAGGLVAPVPRRPGQKEGRVAHLLGEADPTAEVAPSPAEAAVPGEADVPPEVWSAIGALRDEVATLRARLDEVRTGLGLDDAGT